MKRRLRQNALYPPILVAALVALALLASLQYYWVGRVSAAEQERTRATLRAGAQRFSEDFDRELARMYLSLQIDAETLRDQDWERYARRVDHWTTTAPYPGLVDSIYLVELRDRGSLHIERFDPQARTFLPSSWPSHMSGVWQRFMQSYRDATVEGGALVSSAPPPVAEEVPALLVPVARTYLLADEQQLDVEASFLYGDTILAPPNGTCLGCEPVQGGVPLLAHLVITLNREYLRDQFIPALAQRYFAGGDGLDYRLTIMSKGPEPRVVYRSTPAGELPIGDGDAAVDLLSVRLDELNRFLLDDSLRTDDEKDRAPVAIGILSSRSTEANAAEGQWRLVITHRAGSLERAAAELQTRNLALSLGTLLLLASSVVLMIVMARRSQRLAQQKIDFVTVVSHELRTPLAVICSAGENLADGVIQDAERTRRYGEVIHGEGRRLTEMVERVMEFAEIQSGRRAYQMAPLLVGDLVELAIDACALQLRACDARIELALAPDLPPLLGDARALGTALQNLLSNAAKYSGERPWVRVSAELVRSSRAGELAISVADRGMGIASEELGQIFAPFYRGREVMAAQIHGSGLGLQLVERIVRAHGGRVRVTSTVGRGSVFTLYLPCLPGEAALPQPLPSSQ